MRLLVVATYLSTELPTNAPLADMTADLAREDENTCIHLAGLTADQLAGAVAARRGHPVEGSIVGSRGGCTARRAAIRSS